MTVPLQRRELEMGIDLPPNLANQAATAIVRQAEQSKIDKIRVQEQRRLENEARKAQDFANRVKK